MNDDRKTDMAAAQLARDTSATGVVDEVVVRIPPHPRHLRIVRMVAATFAADAGYSIDEVDDVRMAADEVCAAVIEHPSVSGPVTITLTLRGRQLTMTAEAVSDGPISASAPDLDELRAAILGAVTDDFGSTLSDGRMTATFTKAGAATT